jgi:hypothetical protein
MLNTKVQESIIAVVLVGIALFLLNPLNWWMPSNLVMLIATGLAVVFAIYASFAWREKAEDERDAIHRMLAGRIAFLAGSGLLALGIIVQGFAHNVDPWLVVTLAGMVIAKIAGRWWADHRH